jgi:hypothetical protein
MCRAMRGTIWQAFWMRIDRSHLRCCLQLMLAASFLLLTIGQLKQPFALVALDSAARLSTRSVDSFRGPVEEVSSQADLGSSSAATTASVVPIEIGSDLTEQTASFEFDQMDQPARQVFHRRILPPSPNDDK